MEHPLLLLRRRRRGLIAAAMLAFAACTSPLPPGFVHHGHFQRMMHSGDASGRVALSALSRQAGTWGIGATAGLKGEIVQIDGLLLVSPGSDELGRVRAPLAGEEAALFAGSHVQEWRDVAVPQDMESAAFETFIREQAQALGLTLHQPFAFRVEGRFPHLLWHVVTGETTAAGGHGAVGGGGGHGAPGGQGAGHANARSGMRVFRQPGAGGQLIGIYSGAALEGVVSHPGERFHVHYVDSGPAVSGHVDRYSVAAGSVLKLPAR